MASSETTTSAESLRSSSSGSRRPSYWAHMVSHYEKRNASLEQRQTELAERIRLMECAVPSLLMGAMVSMKRNIDPSAKKMSSGPKTNEQTSTSQCNGDPEGKEAQNFRGKEPKGLRRANGRPELSRFVKNTDFRP